MKAKSIHDAVYGCLVAGAVGDALGAPAENMYHQEIREKYGKIEDFLSYNNISYSSGKPGTVTDDTTLRYYMCLAVIEKGGRITPDDAARIWINHINPERFWSPDKIAYLKLKSGVNPWDAGKGNIPSACSTMAMTPIGIINAGNPSQAYQDGYNIAGINAEGFNQEASATLAAGIAATFSPGADYLSVIKEMIRFSSPLVLRAITLTMKLAEKTKDIETFKTEFYTYLIDWWSRPKLNWLPEHFATGTAIETVPLVMAVFYLCKGDVNQCLIEGANFGRDADAISSLSGTLAGGLHGASAIRQEWIEKVEEANRDFFQEAGGNKTRDFRALADEMVNTLRNEKITTLQRAAMLDQILEN